MDGKRGSRTSHRSVPIGACSLSLLSLSLSLPLSPPPPALVSLTQPLSYANGSPTAHPRPTRVLSTGRWDGCARSDRAVAPGSCNDAGLKKGVTPGRGGRRAWPIFGATWRHSCRCQPDVYPWAMRLGEDLRPPPPIANADSVVFCRPLAP